ncbi:hypothetical protein BGZ46_001062 [Entomortierella lignicola]|nr:hypothetical protein BGZ46_001062 [Entomortierella lignicola]
MTATSSSTTPTSKNVFRLHGVNVLNRKNVDSISRLTALEKRRATHILDERQRRDTMNQLLGELANLVRESAEESQQQQQPQQKQYNADGSEKRPPVKSNSITTLRSAINEIRRLRACAGLETVTPPCSASLSVSTPNASRSSSPTETSTLPSKQMQYQQFQQQQHLLPPMPMAPQYVSQHLTSPENYTTHSPHHHHQLQSPPLSPSSPKHQHYSSVSPPMMPIHHHQSSQSPMLPSLFASNSPVTNQYYQQPQPKQLYFQQPMYKTQYQHESPQSSSRPPSPGLSGPMSLPQPYIQNPYQSSPSYAQV